ncbi:MAG: TonB-dependent receptor, partial [Tissierellia bacterium]|nr:TonB-dependent receptor [Tissierellia bacterium]
DLSQVLNELLTSRNIGYEVRDNKIYIFDRPQAASQVAQGQQHEVTIRGTVLDDEGEPIIGANIVEKGTTNGTITDLDGHFSLNTASDAILVITYIGYKAQEIKAVTGTTMEIELEENSKLLDEIVVIGYGTMKKKDLTGAINHIQADKLAKEKPASLQDIIRSSPGLNVSMTNNAKGGGSMIVRGQRSLKGGNGPLIVLNGMIFQGDLSEINPVDIESVDILKDASSAAIYGAKSANGVILITTKKGTEEKPTIRFDASLGFVTMGVNRHVYNPQEYLDYRSDYAASSNGYDKKGYYSKPTAENLSKYNLTEEQWKNYDAIGQGSTNMEDIWLQRIGLGDLERTNYSAGNSYDWYNASFQTGLRQDNNVSLSGKTDKINYYWSLGYLDSEGIVAGDRFETYRTSLRLDAQVTNFLDAGVNLNLQSRDEGFRPVDWAGQIGNSPFSSPYNNDGTLNPWPSGEKAQVTGVNSMYNHSVSSKDAGTQTVTSNFYTRVKLPFNISYQFSFAPRFSWNHERNWTSSQSVFDKENGVASRSTARSLDWTLDNMIKWNYTFNKKHTFDVTLLQSAEKYEIWTEKMTGSDFSPSDVLEWHNMKSAGNKELESDDTVHTGDALMARLFYSFDNRYMLTASVRRDGFSAFGKSNPRATFPALALAWNFSNEKFFDWSPMSNGKLRLSWGKNGNRDIGIYQALSQLYGGTAGKYTYVTPNGTLYEVASLQIERMANHDLRWESTSSWNIGLDFGFLNNRINGSVEWYYMPTTDLMMDRSLPNFTGYSMIVTNLGKVVNEGFEISLNTVNIDNKNLTWSSTFGLSHNKNQIKHLYYRYEDVIDEGGNITGTKEIDDVNKGWFIGKDIKTIWDNEFIGIWQENEAEEAAKYGQKPGDAKARDVNNDYKIDQKDKVFLGSESPKFRLSLRNDFTLYKNWDISFNLYSHIGQKKRSTEYLNYFTHEGDYRNTYKRDYWTPENQSNGYARLKSTRPSNINPQKVINTSFVRLENISLSYKIPTQISSKLKAQDIRLYATVRNVAVWTFSKDWDYWDPETSGLIPRTYTIGASVTF